MDDQLNLPIAFSARGSAKEFDELVRQYADLVYSTAYRLVGETHLADDVTQATFILLAKKAGTLDSRRLPGWLVKTARLTAMEAMRSRRNRTRNEALAARLRAAAGADDPTLSVLVPLLDDALSHLNETDRTAVVMRFFQGVSFADVGSAIGVTEEAARKRVTRAVEKLRKILLKQSVTASAGALVVTLATQQAKSAPAAVVTSAAGVLSGATTSALNLADGVISMMNWKQIKLVALVSLVIVLIGGSGLGLHLVNQASAQSPAATMMPATSSSIADDEHQGQMFRIDCQERAPLSFGNERTEKQVQAALLAREDTEASLLIGGSARVNPDMTDTIPVGLSVKVKIHITAEDKLRVVGSASDSYLDGDGEGNVIVRETAVHFAKTIMQGDRIEIDLNNGRKISLKVSPVAAK